MKLSKHLNISTNLMLDAGHNTLVVFKCISKVVTSCSSLGTNIEQCFTPLVKNRAVIPDICWIGSDVSLNELVMCI